MCVIIDYGSNLLLACVGGRSSDERGVLLKTNKLSRRKNMKKFTKILVLLLSVALVIGAVAMVVSANDTKTGVFGTDITDDLKSANGSYVLSGDSCITSTVALTADLEIDLNGYALSAACDMFKVDTGVNFTIKGEGKIYLFGAKLINSTAAAEAGPNVTVQGTKGRGIAIEHSGVAAPVVSATVGNYTFDHVSMVSTATYSSPIVFFDNGKNAVGANWSFINFAFECSTAIGPGAPSATGTSENVTSFVEVSGNSGSINFEKSTVCHVGNVVFMEAAKSATDRVMITVNDSKLEAVPAPGFRVCTFDGGWGATASGKIVANNSVISGGYAVVMTAGNTPGANAGYVDTVSLEATDCILRNTGMKSNSENGAISGCAYITAKGNTQLITMGSVMARSGKTFVVPGVRSNVNFDSTRTVDVDGNLIGQSTKIKVAFDPSNATAPYVIVDANADVYPNPDKAGVQNFENNNDKPNDAQAKENAANGTNFIAVSPIEGDTVGATVKNGGTSWMSSNWWNLSGNFGIEKTATNNYMKYYVPGPVGSAVKVQNNGKTPNLEFSVGGSYNIANMTVAVFSMDIATDTGVYPNANIFVHARTSTGAATASGLTLTSEGLLTFPSSLGAFNLPTDGSWSTLTAVIYRDTTSEFSSKGNGAGAVYWYLNGELIGMVNGISGASAVTLHGMRFDVLAGQTAGASLLTDNWVNDYYTSYRFEGEGMGKENHKPDNYASIGGNYGTSAASPAVLLENEGYYDFNEAIKAAEDSEFDLILNRDVEDLIVVEDRVVIWSNGYTITTLNGSTAISPIFDANRNIIAYALDPNYDVYKVTYAYFTGDYSDIEQVLDWSYYDLVEYGIGQIPDHDIVVTDQYFSHKVGQTIYAGSQAGWGDNYGSVGEYNDEGSLVTLDVPTPITEEFGVAHNGEIIPKFPVFEATPITGYNYIIVAKDGRIRLKFNSTSAIWNSQFVDSTKTNAFLLDDGDTLILNGNSVKLAGAIEGLKRTGEAATVLRTINVDLNGYNVVFDPTAGSADAAQFFSVRNNEIINLYSSVPGAVIDMRGVRNSSTKVASSGAIFSICNDISYNVSVDTNKLTADEAIKIAKEGYFQINFGKCVDLDGNVTDGSNITAYSEALAYIHGGDANSLVNVDGVNFVRNGAKGANGFIESDIFLGTVNVSNSEIVSLHGGAFVSSSHKDRAVNSNATVNFDGVKILTADATANFFDPDSTGINTVTFENCAIGTTLAKTNENAAVIVGAGNVFYAINAEGITLPEGHIVAPCSELAPFTAGAYNKVVATAGSDAGTYTFSMTPVTFAPAGEDADFVIPVLGAKVVAEDTVKKVTVTFVDFGGKTVYETEVYAGDKITAPDLEIEGIAGNPISYVFGGEWENLPEFATEDVTVTPKKVAVLNLNKNSLLQNLTLHASFSVNLFVPVSTDYTVKSVVVGETALDVTNVVTVDGVQYVKVCANKNVVELGNDVEFVITVTAGEYEASETVAISVVKYAEYIIGGDFSEESKDLMKYIITYAKAANDYFNVPNDTIDAAAGNVTVEGFEKNYTALTAEEKAVIGTVFSIAEVDLNGKAPAYKFTVAEGFTGTVKINGVDYEPVDGVIVVDNIVAYEFLKGVTVVAGETTFTYTFGNYAAEAGVDVAAIVDAIYNYCTAAAAYVATK